VPKGCELCLISARQDGSGVTTVLDRIANDDQAASKQIVLCAPGAWDAVMGLVQTAGPKHYGCGYLDTLWRTLKTLSGPSREPLTLWMDDVRYMRLVDREMLVCLIEWVAQQLKISIRLVMIVGPVRVFISHQQGRERQCIQAPRLMERKGTRLFEMTAAGMNELEDATTMFTPRERKPDEQTAVKIA
jgi:hypothetical protein